MSIHRTAVSPLKRRALSPRRAWMGNLAVVLLALLISIAGAELILRVALLPKEFPQEGVVTSTNFWKKVGKKVIGVGTFDEELGWLPNFDTFETDSEGNRLNGNKDNKDIHAGEARILVIGDSYTWGSEVEFHESWPAQLEWKSGMRVINAGVGGYGLGQMLGRLRRSLQNHSPGIVILAFITPDVDRIALTVRHGFNKPYYTIGVDNGLILHPAVDNRFSNIPWFKKIAGYSYATHFLMKTLFPNYWFRGSIYDFQYSGVDKVKLSIKIVDEIIRVVTADPTRELIFALLPMEPEDLTTTNLPVATHLKKVAVSNDAVFFANIQVLLRLRVPDGASRNSLFLDTTQGYWGHYNKDGNGFVADVFNSAIDSHGNVRQDAITSVVRASDIVPFSVIELVEDAGANNILRLGENYAVLSKSVGRIDFTTERLGDRNLWPHILRGADQRALEIVIRKKGGDPANYAFGSYKDGIVAVKGLDQAYIGQEFFGKRSLPPHIFVHKQYQVVREFAAARRVSPWPDFVLKRSNKK